MDIYLCPSGQHFSDQFMGSDDEVWQCRVCHAPYNYPSAAKGALHLADESTPHTADIVEPPLCLHLYSNTETRWYCENESVPGYAYCREHIW